MPIVPINSYVTGTPDTLSIDTVININSNESSDVNEIEKINYSDM